MSETDAFWQGSFGDTYHQRNQVDWGARMPFWESAIQFTECKSVLEVGCGPGWNLRAIQAVNHNIDAYGVDLNADAVRDARSRGLDVQQTNALGILGIHEPGSIDLVFTAGCLIHIPPKDLEATMKAIARTSAGFVLAIEYEAEAEEEIDYRGHSGKLWRRPFGKLYEDIGLKLLSFGEAGGFDACTYWLMQK